MWFVYTYGITNLIRIFDKIFPTWQIQSSANNLWFLFSSNHILNEIRYINKINNDKNSNDTFL